MERTTRPTLLQRPRFLTLARTYREQNMNIRGWRAYGLVILRSGVGLGLIYHGAAALFAADAMEGMSKFVGSMGFPAPTFFAYCAKLTEFLGGICLVLGTLFRPAALVVVFNMAVAAFVAHGGHPIFAPPGKPSKEMALMYLIATITLFLTGPGPLAAGPWIKGFWRAWREKKKEERK